tara:strand:- start:226 stop:846 length:621 start_codon:yes stop_codon:yes gene_type:complete
MKTNFKKDKYAIIKKAIDKNLSVFLYNYFHIKKQVAQTLFNTRYISPYTNDYGIWSDPQVPNTYSHYADIAMETLLIKCQPIMEKATKLKLYPSYSYARIYKNNDELKKHRDRFSCEISTTMNLGGDPWPIFLKSSKKQIKVNLKPGDMLVYRGCELEHWREKFDGKDCVQVFLHYNNSKTKGALDNIFDNRKHIGLPSWFKNKNV